MSSNPYTPPAKNSDAKPMWAVSSVVASLLGVAIWLGGIAAVWIEYKPTFVNGDLHIEYEVQSADPFLTGYVESDMSIWMALVIVAMALIAIQFAFHYIARLYQRRLARRQTLRDVDSTPLL